MKLSVIGCGYLGAVHAVSMASLGHEVIALDVDSERIDKLSQGISPFYEPEFDELLSASVASGRLRFTTEVSELAPSQVHFLAVGTPQSREGGTADLSYVHNAVNSLLPHLAEGSLIVGKSTVPVGTAAEIAATLSQQAPHASLAWNPEFLREGFAVQDTLRPDRIVYGVQSGDEADPAVEILDRVYQDALNLGTPRLVMGYATAELVKVAANAFLATKISFINAMAEISEVVGADVTQLADAIGHDARIGRRFLNAGVGFGGGCLPKDIRAFAARAEELGLEKSVNFLHEVDAINLRRRERVTGLTLELLGGTVSGKRIAVLGASFKPNSDDVRDSPALEIAAQLADLGAHVTVADPRAIENARHRYPQLSYTNSATESLEGAEIVLLLTEWAEYKDLDPALARSLVGVEIETPAIIDGRNCLSPESWQAAGWKHIGLGR